MILTLDVNCYELNTGCRVVHNFEFKPRFVDDNAVHTLFPCLGAIELLADVILSILYSTITWINNNKSAWTMNAGSTAADDEVNTGPRPLP